MELFNKEGGKLGLFDVIDWWCEKYPEDRYPTAENYHVAKVREHMLKIAKGIVKDYAKNGGDGA